MSKIVKIFLIFFSLKNINLGLQVLLKTFFNKFNFKNNLFLKLGRKIVNFLNLSTLSEKLQKKFRCNFCDSASVSFIVISFHRTPLTWWNAYIRCNSGMALGLKIWGDNTDKYIVIGGHNLPPVVDLGSTDLKKSGGRAPPSPCSPGSAIPATYVWFMSYSTCWNCCRTWNLWFLLNFQLNRNQIWKNTNHSYWALKLYLFWVKAP